MVRRYTSGVWKLVYDTPSQKFLNGVWISGSSGPYVVDDGGALFAFDRVGTVWKQAATLGGSLNAIWGPAGGQGKLFYVGGNSGRLYRCTSSGASASVSCALMTSPTSADIHRL